MKGKTIMGLCIMTILLFFFQSVPLMNSEYQEPVILIKQNEEWLNEDQINSKQLDNENDIPGLHEVPEINENLTSIKIPSDIEVHTRSMNRAVVLPSIQLGANVISKTIDISTQVDSLEYFVEYPISIRYASSGSNATTVFLEIDNPTELTAEFYEDGSKLTSSSISLLPNITREIVIRVSADEHEHEGVYSIIFRVLDESAAIELNSTILTTTMEQYYNIELEKLSSKNYTREIDPNKMINDYQIELFEVNLKNFGNGRDVISLDWSENPESRDLIPITWEDSLVEIEVIGDESEIINKVSIPPFNKTTETPGVLNLLIKILIPRDDRDGEFMIDLNAISSASRNYLENLSRNDFKNKDNTTFSINVVLTDLSFDTANSMLRKDGSKILPDDIIRENDIVELYMVIENRGSGEATEIEIKFIVLLESIEVKNHKSIVTVPVNGNIVLSWLYVPIEDGMYYFKVTIDPKHELIGDLQEDNTWNQYLSVQPSRKDQPNQYRNGITITTKDNSEFEAGETIKIEGTWESPEYLDISIMMSFKYPDGSQTQSIVLPDKTSAINHEYGSFIEIKPDGNWEFTYEPSNSALENSVYTFTFKAVYSDPSNPSFDEIESDKKSITVIIGPYEELNLDDTSKEKGEESKTMSIGLFSFDILMILIVILILSFMIVLKINSANSKGQQSVAYMESLPQSPLITCNACGYGMPVNSWSCPACHTPMKPSHIQHPPPPSP